MANVLPRATEILSRRETDALVDLFLEHRTKMMDQMLMKEMPTVYNKLMAKEIVKVVYCQDGLEV